jgi:hypothetical protein
MLDNGAYTFWQQGTAAEDWTGYYDFAAEWMDCKTTWAVSPDVIDGSVEENIKLISQWPHGLTQAAPVWHLDEPIDHLMFMLQKEIYSRICIGSSGRFAQIGTEQWHRRMTHVFNKIADPSGRMPVAIHMLRGMALCQGLFPFASVDSTDIARHHCRGGDIRSRADRWDSVQTPIRWHRQMTQQDYFGEE